MEMEKIIPDHLGRPNVGLFPAYFRAVLARLIRTLGLRKGTAGVRSGVNMAQHRSKMNFFESCLGPFGRVKRNGGGGHLGLF